MALQLNRRGSLFQIQTTLECSDSPAPSVTGLGDLGALSLGVSAHSYTRLPTGISPACFHHGEKQEICDFTVLWSPGNSPAAVGKFSHWTEVGLGFLICWVQLLQPLPVEHRFEWAGVSFVTQAQLLSVAGSLSL